MKIRGIRKIVSLSLCFVMGATMASALTACAAPEHTHSWSTSWTSDETHHWHACDGCDEKSDKAEHNWSTGEITTQPTASSDGVKTFTCTVAGCGKTKTESVAFTQEYKNALYSTALKNVADQTIKGIFGSSAEALAKNGRSARKVEDSEDSKTYFSWSVTIVYWLGLLYEDPQFDVTEYPVLLEGEFDYLDDNNNVEFTDYSNKTLFAEFDTANNKINVFMSQIFTKGSSEESYLFFDIAYNFDSETLSSFVLGIGYNNAPGISGGCVEYDGSKCWCIEESDDEFTEYSVAYVGFKNKFDTQRAIKTVTASEEGVNTYAPAATYCFGQWGETVNIVPHSKDSQLA